MQQQQHLCCLTLLLLLLLLVVVVLLLLALQSQSQALSCRQTAPETGCDGDTGHWGSQQQAP
jgi:hypothetical protein